MEPLPSSHSRHWPSRCSPPEPHPRPRLLWSKLRSGLSPVTAYVVVFFRRSAGSPSVWGLTPGKDAERNWSACGALSVSLYNTFSGMLSCPSCGEIDLRFIQFRYGHVRLYTYTLGSPIIWGPGAVGDASNVEVVVDGWLDECRTCGLGGRYAIFVRSGIIYGAGPTWLEPDLAEQGWLLKK